MSDRKPASAFDPRHPWNHPTIFHFQDIVDYDADENSTYFSVDTTDIGRHELQFSITRIQERTDADDEITVMASAGVDDRHIRLLRDLLTDWLVLIGKEAS